ncbi:MAG: glutathione peroxidase [Candidatus Zixiibacteriota bacterium]
MSYRTIMSVVLILTLLTGAATAMQNHDKTAKTETDNPDPDSVIFTAIPFNTITGEPTALDKIDAKAYLLVNVASRCGFTRQYEGLEALYRKYKDRGLVVIGFPANNFGGQEPGSDEEILKFCTSRFDVTFPMMSKISVKAEDIHPLYAWLTEKSAFPGEIKWNFTKFLLDGQGKVVARFEPEIKPSDEELVRTIDNLLK